MLAACAAYGAPVEGASAQMGIPDDVIKYTSEGVGDNPGVVLEVAKAIQNELTLVMTNNTSLDVVYNDGFSVNLMVDGSLTPFGSGVMGSVNSTLPPGGQTEIRFTDRPYLWPGEFRITKTVLIGSEEYELHVEFAVEDESIPPDVDGFVMEVSVADPIGVVLELTNGFDRGRVYFDRNYRLLRNIGGQWHEVPEINTRFFPDNEHFVAPRQARSFTKNWGWLHGELEPGEYRLEKSFRHHTYGDEIARLDVYAEFSTVSRPPSPPDVLMYNPFDGRTTFRAEVTRGSHHNCRESAALLVNTITPLWSGTRIDEPIYVEENHYVAVLNVYGEPILFSDIPQGAVVDVTFSGIVLQSLPGILPGAILIQMVE